MPKYTSRVTRHQIPHKQSPSIFLFFTCTLATHPSTSLSAPPYRLFSSNCCVGISSCLHASTVPPFSDTAGGGWREHASTVSLSPKGVRECSGHIGIRREAVGVWLDYVEELFGEGSLSGARSMGLQLAIHMAEAIDVGCVVCRGSEGGAVSGQLGRGGGLWR